MLRKRWMLTSLLVIAAVLVMVRLGFWQLDRLEQRRNFNQQVGEQINQPALELRGPALQQDLTQMEYRKVHVTGEYDFSQEIALRNQVNGNAPGVSLVTPLRIGDSGEVILVERGWIPAEDSAPGAWQKYQRPGEVTVEGIIRSARSRADFGGIKDPIPAPGEQLKAWYFVNIPAIQQQMPYEILPVYIQAAPIQGEDRLPKAWVPQLDLSEGPHMSYAIQWFAFAAVLGLGYPLFIRKQEAEIKPKR
jgi:surfeit locus 1 family protein